MTYDSKDTSEGRYSADEAVLLLQDWIRTRAASMCRRNASLSDDLTQEMSMGVLRCRREHTLAFFRRRAGLRALDFLRREKRHKIKVERYGRLHHPLSEDDDTPFIEGLVDLESKLSSRCSGADGIVQLYPDTRASA